MTRRILISSTSGIGSREYLGQIATALSSGAPIFVDDCLLSELGYKSWFEAHQELVFSNIREAWPTAYNKAKANAGESSLLVHSHLVHYNDNLQFPFVACDFSAFRGEGVAAVLTLIDDVYEMLSERRHTGLWNYIKDPQDPVKRAKRYVDSVGTLLMWRRFDLLAALCLANSLEVPHYLVAVRHPPSRIAELLRRLCEQEQANSVYFSHHIREIRSSSMEDGWRDQANLINGAAREVEQSVGLVPFEPTTIDEYVSSGDGFVGRWPRDYDGRLFLYQDHLADCLEAVRLSSEQVGQVFDAVSDSIGRDITWRDLLLVYQCDHLLMWRPFWHGKLSSGATQELKVFSDREFGGRAIFVHQRGDLATWLTDVLGSAVEAGGVRLSTNFLEGAGSKIEEMLTGPQVNWEEIAGLIAADLTDLSSDRGILTMGGGGQLPSEDEVAEKRRRIALGTVDAVRVSSNGIFDGMEKLRNSDRLIHLVADDLSSSEAIRGAVGLDLKTMLGQEESNG